MYMHTLHFFLTFTCIYSFTDCTYRDRQKERDGTPCKRKLFIIVNSLRTQLKIGLGCPKYLVSKSTTNVVHCLILSAYPCRHIIRRTGCPRENYS